jgi:hypothetical protein
MTKSKRKWHFKQHITNNQLSSIITPMTSHILYLQLSQMEAVKGWSAQQTESTSGFL